jgi:peptidoglycan/LPS O-acetylase OafA/YrhL
MKQINDLTSCRALFAGWVFAYHLNLQAKYGPILGPLEGVIQHGPDGVDGFFMLSGMILAYAHPALSISAADAREFCAKRLVRIYPVHLAMIVALGLMVIVAAVMGMHPRDPGRFGFDELISHLALVHAWGFSDRWAWNYPSWSISAEWAGYLAFPLLWPALRARRAAVCAMLLPVAFAGVAFAQMYGRAEDLSLTYDGGLVRFFPEFIVGILTTRLLPSVPAWVNGRVMAGAGLVIMVVASALQMQLGTLLGIFPFLAGLMLTNLQGAPTSVGQWRPLRWLGEISYSYYMSFALVETLQATLWRTLDVAPENEKLLYIVTTTALTLGVATLAFRLVERPCMQTYSAYRRRRRARQPGLAAP